ncbi:phosphatidylserine decarboxylase proenzyme [mine drainage metagenome]|uniref:Phosphatidylserine decarboxylase proenzyme n=1 Tax=mine drainage metagenome TaxID=410659 RepID=A0A1J5Q8D8_9ZZZZ
MSYPHPILAREGWPFIASSVMLSVLVWAVAGFWWSLPLWILTTFVVQFFRDPERPIPQDPLAVLSPADGRIVAIEHAFDSYAQRDALKISVFMNVFNVHSNRAPVDGQLRSVQYFPGRFFNADLDKASEQNERNALVIDSAGRLVTVVQVAGLIARRILCYVKAGESVQRGQRFGFIRFGSRVDVYLPLGSRSRVSIGDKVYASSTVLADFAV